MGEVAGGRLRTPCRPPWRSSSKPGRPADTAAPSARRRPWPGAAASSRSSSGRAGRGSRGPAAGPPSRGRAPGAPL
eukprot:2908538-Alexandrium_andersonii.AAC.1